MNSEIQKSEQLSWITEQSQNPSAEPTELVLQRIMTFLHQTNPSYHWVGVYRLGDETLHLGPYAGPVTDHIEIPVGRGVCGTAVAEDKDQVVDDVSQVDNYLACNLYTRSEMVALIRDTDQTILGQLDIDANEIKLFDLAEQGFVRKVATQLSPLLKSGQQQQRSV